MELLLTMISSQKHILIMLEYIKLLNLCNTFSIGKTDKILTTKHL